MEEKIILQYINRIKQNKDLILLEPMGKETRKKFYKISEKEPNINVFSIGKGSKKRMVLKFTKKPDNYIEYKQIINKAKNLYKNKQYQESIKVLIDFMLILNEPKAFVYYFLGINYYKINDIKNTVKYLTIYKYLSNKNLRLTNFLEHLKKVNGIFDMEINEEEFKYSIEKKTNIKYINDIVKLVVYQGQEVNKVCKQYDLNKAEESLAKLIIAREYFFNNRKDLGNNILKNVEKTTNKSKKTKDILEEIKINKKLYKHQINRFIGR